MEPTCVFDVAEFLDEMEEKAGEEEWIEVKDTGDAGDVCRVHLTPTFVSWVIERSGMGLRVPELSSRAVIAYPMRRVVPSPSSSSSVCVVCGARVTGACVEGCGDPAHVSHAECCASVSLCLDRRPGCVARFQPRAGPCTWDVVCHLTLEAKAALDLSVTTRLGPDHPMSRAARDETRWRGFRSSTWVHLHEENEGAGIPTGPCAVCGIEDDMGGHRCRGPKGWTHPMCWAYLCEMRLVLPNETLLV